MQRDAFVLFVERMQPRFFDSSKRERAKDDAADNIAVHDVGFPSPSGAQEPLAFNSSLSSGGTSVMHPSGVVRRYRSTEDSWARARRKSVPVRVLEDLLAAWKKRESGLTPAEYGSAFVGPSQVARMERKRDLLVHGGAALEVGPPRKISLRCLQARPKQAHSNRTEEAYAVIALLRAVLLNILITLESRVEWYFVLRSTAYGRTLVYMVHR